MQYRVETGFTLLELMVTVAVVAILAAVAFPSFEATLRSNRLATANNELRAAIGLARTEAITNRRGAGICAANATASGCDATATDWAVNGWLVWSDANATPGFQTGDTVVKVSQTLPKVTLAHAAGGTASVQFDGRGRPASTMEFSLQPTGCASKEVGQQRVITMNASGQTRTQVSDCK